MKKRNLRDFLITIIFLVILIVPSILYWIFYNQMDHTNYENRSLYSKPNLEFNNIINFPIDYENYYNDNIPFKNEIRHLYSDFLYTKFNMSSNSRVLVGKNGWLFYNSVPDGDSMSDYRKIYNYSVETKENIKDKLIEIERKLQEKGIEFYVLILPNKELVYNEYMPNTISINENNKYSRTEDLVNYLFDKSDLNIVFPKQALIENKEISDTYFKYDTHWNNFGAYIGTMELMKLIKPTFESPKISIGNNESSGDLANLLLMPDKLLNDEPVIENFYDEVETICEIDGQSQICTASKGINKKSILVIGDSFRENMVQYLSKLYRKSIFVHRDYFDESLIDKYKPDIIVYEVVERYSYFLENIQEIIKN